MGKKKKETMEFRFYEKPQNEPVLALLGDSWIRVYGHEETRLHFHNLMEIGYCRKGEGTLILCDQECHYTTSMFTIIPANYPHTTISDGEGTNYWEYLFLDPQEMIAELYPDNPLYQREMLETVNQSTIARQQSEYPELAALIGAVMEEMRQRKPHYQDQVRNLLRAVLVEIIRIDNQILDKPAEHKALRSTRTTQISPALDYISWHYASVIKVQELAAVCNMSETHFRRLFEEFINMSPMDYLNLVRIQKACDIMKKTNASMDSVAVACGFTTTSTFNRNFKKFLDASPYQWKINPKNYERKLLNFNISALKGW